MSVRSNSEKEIKKHFETVWRFIKQNKSFFEEMQDFILKNEPLYCDHRKNQKSTHYFYLLSYYNHQFKVFESNIYLGEFLVTLNKSIEEINSFVSIQLAPLVTGLFDTQTEYKKKIVDADVVGVPYYIFVQLKRYEVEAYEKLSFINRTMDVLSDTVKAFTETPSV